MDTLLVLQKKDLLNLVETSEAALRARKVDYLDVLGGYPPNIDSALCQIEKIKSFLNNYFDENLVLDDEFVSIDIQKLTV